MDARMKNFPIDPQSLDEMSDWEIVCIHKYLRMVNTRGTLTSQTEYMWLLTMFSDDKESLDAWIYKLTKLFEYEYYTRHQN